MYDLRALDLALCGTVFADKLHFLESTGSTNSDAMAGARNGAPHGSVYFANEQTSGRGRGDHGWHSATGEGLYVSVVLRLAGPAARLALLPLAAGLAAADAIHGVAGLSADLRWPNDLLIGPHKTGGILVEASSDSGGLPFAIVGIGINVHQRGFPADLATPATSLDLMVKSRISRQILLVALLKSVEREALTLLDPAKALAIPARVEQASSWIRGRSVLVHGPQACQGITAGLDENGFLRVETEGGIVTVQTGGLREA